MRRLNLALVIGVALVALLVTAHLDDGAPTMRVPAERSASLVAPLQAPVLDAEQVPALILPEGAYGEQEATTTTPPVASTAATTTAPPPPPTDPPTTTTEAPTTTVAPEPEPEHMTERNPGLESTTTMAQPAYGSGQCGGGYLPTCAIMMCESGGSLTAYNASSGASGKWQIIRSTWAGYGGYAEARDAPEEVQDARAAEIWNGGAGRGQWEC